MIDHEDHCDKITLDEGGICTCGSMDDYSEPSAAAMGRMEDYEGPALDW